MLCGLAAGTGRWDEGRVAFVALAAAAAGAGLAFLRSIGDIRHPALALAACAAVAAFAAAMYAAGAPLRNQGTALGHGPGHRLGRALQEPEGDGREEHH